MNNRQIANSQTNLLSKVRKRVKAAKRNNKSQTSINKLFTKQKENNARLKVTIFK